MSQIALTFLTAVSVTMTRVSLSDQGLGKHRLFLAKATLAGKGQFRPRPA